MLSPRLMRARLGEADPNSQVRVMFFEKSEIRLVSSRWLADEDIVSEINYPSITKRTVTFKDMSALASEAKSARCTQAGVFVTEEVHHKHRCIAFLAVCFGCSF